MRSISRAVWLPLLLAPLLLAARCPVPGQTAFTSAEGAGPWIAYDIGSPILAVAPTASSPTVDVAEGDLFRVLAPGLLLNLNAYRGLQVIDISDVSSPKVTGRVPLGGQPVELYVEGDTAFVLVNGSSLQDGSAGLVGQSVGSTGLILAVDLSDPAHPTVIDQASVPGYITTSRLTRSGDRAALYVVSNAWSQTGDSWSGHRTHVSSFDVASDHLVPAAQLDLGGYSTAVQATPEMLLVALMDDTWWSGAAPGTRVTLVDIRDPAGAMSLGDDLFPVGVVHNQFNMDYRNGVVRIVSGRRWGASDNENHLETFDASDPANVVPIDAVSFGSNEDLFATLFLGDRAFAVTYFRIDPFHTFEISDEGVITPGAHFEVSGWNNFFHAVFDDARLIGVGIDDQGQRSLAVSLYDVSDISNPQPLLDRERVVAGSDSVANFDHQGFSVLEDAVAVAGPGGVTETGLVLLPVTDWSVPSAGVQIFTFSARTLTQRGVMEHGSFVERSFAADDELVANLSSSELSLFATADPDAPAELGRLELAPNYTDVFRFGDHWVRVVRRNDSFNWYPVPSPPAIIEVLPGDAHPDRAEAVAQFEIPAEATLYRSGPYLVTVVYPSIEPAAETDTEVRVFDLRDPAQPVQAGVLLTDRLPRPWLFSPYTGLPGMVAPCFYCFDAYPSGPANVAAVPNGLAFLQPGPDGGWSFDLLDLRDPAAPVFAPRIASGDFALDAGTRAMDLLVDGSDAWIALSHAIRPDRKGRSLTRHFILRVGVSDLAAPTASTPINVPGELFAIDAGRIFTRDLQWTGDVLETGVVRLALEADRARVEAVRWFADRSVEAVRLDGAGHVLVSHGQSWQWPGPILMAFPLVQTPGELAILDADSADLGVLAEIDVAVGAALLDAIPGRALLRVGSGLLIFDFDDAANPRPRAFFGTSQWLDELLIEGRTAYAAGGRYGILGFDLDASNLAAPPSPSRLRIQ
jgi:hypothetical protein